MNSSNLARLIADPIRPYMYISDEKLSSVHILNTSTYQIEASIVVGSKPTIMDIKADGSLLFVTISGGNQIAVINLSSKTLLEPIDLTFRSFYMAKLFNIFKN
jgi:DNA-binding beta-propeller fold protein YncE